MFIKEEYTRPETEFLTIINSKADYVQAYVKTKKGAKVDFKDEKLTIKQAQDLINKHDNGLFIFNSSADCLTIKDKTGICQYITIELYSINIKLNERFNEELANSTKPIRAPHFS